MDPNIDSAPDISVKLLRLAIGHCIELADEAGLPETSGLLHHALDNLGGPLPSIGGRNGRA
jgi:hypothetical protein